MSAVAKDTIVRIIRDEVESCGKHIMGREKAAERILATLAAVCPPRHPTDRMMEAGLYQSSHDATYADVFSSWVDMWDAWQMEDEAAPVSAHEGFAAAVWVKPEHLKRMLDAGDPMDGAMVWAEQRHPDFVPLAAMSPTAVEQDSGAFPAKEPVKPTEREDGAVVGLLNQIADLCTSFNDQIHDADDTLGQICQLAYRAMSEAK
jgi:hypothetical protein